MATQSVNAIWLTVAMISLIILLPLFVSLLRSFSGDATQDTDKLYKYLAISTFLCNIIYNITMVICCILLLSDSNFVRIRFQIFFFMSLLGGTLSVYGFLLYRIKNTFNGTVYQIKSYALCLHYINMLFIMITFSVTYWPVIANPDLLFCMHLIYFILCMIGYLHLLYVFNHNLFLLVLSRSDARDSVVNNEIEWSHGQIRLLTTIRKHTILACVILISSLFSVIIFTVVFHHEFGPRENVSETHMTVIWSLWIIALFVLLNTGPLCIYLGFSVNNRLYQKICNVCDGKCRIVCMHLAENTLVKNNKANYVQMNDQVKSQT